MNPESIESLNVPKTKKKGKAKINTLLKTKIKLQQLISEREGFLCEYCFDAFEMRETLSKHKLFCQKRKFGTF